MAASSRYVIGIDLGTTNSAIAYVDTMAEDPRPQILPVGQLERPGSHRDAASLPSFLYLAAESDPVGGCDLEFQTNRSPAAFAVGAYARTQAERVSGRVINSAKSWLCHDGVDRSAAILPWGSSEIPAEEKLSPVAVSACYLKHFCDFWNFTIARHEESYRFERQEVCITVPASFDEVAQQLTLAAAREAGYPEGVRLLEEPQAAFYAWLARHRAAELDALLPKRGRKPRRVLVVDIGGGTTDFSLFEISSGRDGRNAPDISRIAVSDHLLLGGDNIDLTLAHHFEAQLTKNERLARAQWHQLVAQSRTLKEKMLNTAGMAEGAEEPFHVSVAGEGRGLFAAARSASILRSELQALVLEGFFPLVPAAERPGTASGGLQEWGLPFAADSAVTRHLAAFLEGRQVDALLCNGGTLIPSFLQTRLRELLASWQGGRAPVVLENNAMDLSVAYGAARYGLLLRAPAGRIRGGYPHAVYLELQAEQSGDTRSLVCVLPKGTEAHETVPLEEHQFHLTVHAPVKFQLHYSNHRENDSAGKIVAWNEREFLRLPLIQTKLSSEKAGVSKKGKIRSTEIVITLEGSLSETGIFQLYCVEAGVKKSPERWKLEFNLRKASEESGDEAGRDLDFGIDAQRIRQALDLINHFYGKGKELEAFGSKKSPKGLAGDLEKQLAQKRADWNMALLRMLWTALAGGITRRGRSPEHESVWLYLAGFFLRPGYGAELDKYSVADVWRCFELGRAFPREKRLGTRWWMMWRRVAGGLTAGQQEQLFAVVIKNLQKKGALCPELVRLAVSLERVSVDAKQQVAAVLVTRVKGKEKKGRETFLTALGRLGSRVPLYGSTHTVLPAGTVMEWFRDLSSWDWSTLPNQSCNLLFSQAARISGDRHRDLEDADRQEILTKMQASGAGLRQLQVVREFVSFEEADRAALFGERLPSGIRLVE